MADILASNILDWQERVRQQALDSLGAAPALERNKRELAKMDSVVSLLKAAERAEQRRRMAPTAIGPVDNTVNWEPVVYKEPNVINDPDSWLNRGLKNLLEATGDVLIGRESGVPAVDYGTSNVPGVGPVSILLAGGIPGILDVGGLRGLARPFYEVRGRVVPDLVQRIYDTVKSNDLLSGLAMLDSRPDLRNGGLRWMMRDAVNNAVQDNFGQPEYARQIANNLKQHIDAFAELNPVIHPHLGEWDAPADFVRVNVNELIKDDDKVVEASNALADVLKEFRGGYEYEDPIQYMLGDFGFSGLFPSEAKKLPEFNRWYGRAAIEEYPRLIEPFQKEADKLQKKITQSQNRLSGYHQKGMRNGLAGKAREDELENLAQLQEQFKYFDGKARKMRGELADYRSAEAKFLAEDKAAAEAEKAAKEAEDLRLREEFRNAYNYPTWLEWKGLAK